jgi:phage baseplate assembly protein V
MNSVLKNLIRIGRISAVNPEKATARVVFEAQGVVSYDLPVLQRQTLNNKDYCLPDVGEYVVCIFLPTGNAEGFILGAIYSEENEAPANSSDKRVISFSDGTTIEYDRSTHTLSINTVGPVNIVASGNINITGDVIADGISLKNHTHPETGTNTETPQ